MGIRINGKRVVFVAGVIYDAGGLFNWYWDQAEAEDMFRRDYSTEEFDRTSALVCHWTAFYFVVPLPEELSEADEIAAYIDREVWSRARLPLCDHCGAGCFFNGGAGCDEWQAGGFRAEVIVDNGAGFSPEGAEAFINWRAPERR